MGMSKQELAHYARRIAEAQKKTVKNREPWIAVEIATTEAGTVNTDETYRSLATRLNTIAGTQPASDAWRSIKAVADELATTLGMAPEPEAPETPKRRRRRAAESTEGEPPIVY